jgi:hypothetical protein
VDVHSPAFPGSGGMRKEKRHYSVTSFKTANRMKCTLVALSTCVNHCGTSMTRSFFATSSAHRWKEFLANAALREKRVLLGAVAAAAFRQHWTPRAGRRRTPPKDVKAEI